MSTHDPSEDEYFELDDQAWQGRAGALAADLAEADKELDAAVKGAPGHAKALTDRLAMTAAAKRAEEREQAEAAISDIRPSREERKIRLTAGADRRRGSESAA